MKLRVDDPLIPMLQLLCKLGIFNGGYSIGHSVRPMLVLGTPEVHDIEVDPYVSVIIYG